MNFTTRPELTGTFGMVASTHWIASAVAMSILERGGNAFDAATAGGFALQVVEPHLNGPGGDLPILTYAAASDRVEVVCGQGTAPAGATIEAYGSLGVEGVPGDGLLAAVVPGAFDAWLLMLRDRGTLSLREVLAPAIGYAEQGHPILAQAAAVIAGRAAWFLEAWPSSAALWLPGGGVPVPGAIVRNPQLAATWRRLLEEAESAGGDRVAQIEAARRTWAEGFVAEAIDAFARGEPVADSTGGRHRGFLTGADLAGWRATIEAPAALDYGGTTVFKTAAWGQGPLLLELLALLDGSGIDAADPLGPEFVHAVVEGLKLVMADREAYFGDSGRPVPLATLLSRDYAAARRGEIGREASFEFRPGLVPGWEREVAAARRLAAAAAVAEPAGSAEPTFGHLAERGGRGDTCHIDVADRWGNLVAATPSGGWLQSSPTIPALGFALGSRAQMFRLEPGLPSSLAPGRRPRTTLSPSLARLDGGAAWLAFGTPGGDQQDQWQAIFLLRHLHHEPNLQAAIDAPLFHTEHAPLSFAPRPARPGVVQVEAAMPASTLDELARRGHRLQVQPAWSIGRLCAVARSGGVVKGAATPRLMQAYAVGR